MSFKTVTGVVQLLFLKVIVITITIKITVKKLPTITIKITVKKLPTITITISITIKSTENLF